MNCSQITSQRTLLEPQSMTLSMRQLVEQIRMNLLYRWFIDLSLDGEVWNAMTLTKNRERFEKHELCQLSSVEFG